MIQDDSRISAKMLEDAELDTAEVIKNHQSQSIEA